MFISNEFRFQTNVSVDTYKSKSEATACLSKLGANAIGKNKMAFREMFVNVDEFLDLATSGHAFCNLFEYDPNKEYWFEASNGKRFKQLPVYLKGENKGAMKLCFKSDKYFKGGQIVFVDIDNTRFQDVREYLGKLTYPPTCVYMSFSDKIEKGGRVSRRFRLVYIFDIILDRAQFLLISKVISDQIVMDLAEPMDDDCGTRMSQYMNGVYGNNEKYTSYYIYSTFDFPNELPQICSDLATDEASQQQKIVFDEQLLFDMQNQSYEEFMHYHSWQFEYKYRIEKPNWIGGLYQLTDESYLQLRWYMEKQVDGQHRRRKLFRNACLRHLMFPDMDPNTALFNLYVDFVRFFDNSDSVIQLDTLKRRVKKAFSMSYEQLVAFCDPDIQYWKEHRPLFIVAKGIRTSRGLINSIKKMITRKMLDEKYDRTLSVRENFEKGFCGVSEATLYRYCKESNIQTQPGKKGEEQRRLEKRCEKLEKIALFKRWYNPLISYRENQVEMGKKGLNLSLGSIKNWYEKYIEKHISPTTFSDFPPITYELPEFAAKSSNYLWNWRSDVS